MDFPKNILDGMARPVRQGERGKKRVEKQDGGGGSDRLGSREA